MSKKFLLHYEKDFDDTVPLREKNVFKKYLLYGQYVNAVLSTFR